MKEYYAAKKIYSNTTEQAEMSTYYTTLETKYNDIESARKQVFPLIEQWKKDVEKNLQSQLINLCLETKETVDDWMKRNKYEFEANEQKLQDNLYISDEEKELIKKSLLEDKGILKKYLDSIGEDI